MTIQEVRLVKHDSATDQFGPKFYLEFDVYFTGVYDPMAAQQLTTFTPTGLTEMSITGESEISPNSGIYAGRRQVRLVDLAEGTSPGYFIISVPFDQYDVLSENPLHRKDIGAFYRNAVAKPVARDRKGRIVGTYASVEEGPFNFGGERVIEVFSQLPTIPGAAITSTVTGFRAVPPMAFEDYAVDGPPDDEPSQQQQWVPVNDKPVTIEGVTFPKGTVGLVGGSATPVTVNGYRVFECRWDLSIKPTHNLYVLNAGNYYFDTTFGDKLKLQRIRDGSGALRAGPYPLGKDGKPLDEGFTADKAIYLKFEVTREIDFDSAFGWQFRDASSGFFGGGIP